MTRIPVPPALLRRPLDFRECGWALPLSGVPVGVACVATLHAPLPAFVAGVLAFAVAVLLTGALHEDGVADCADGFWGGHERARRLEIMRRSDIGTYGALALIVISALRIGGYAAVTAMTPWLLLAVAVAARIAMVWHWIALPSARADDGLSARYGEPDKAQAIGGTGLALVLIIPVTVLYPAAVIAGLLGSVVGAGIVTLLARRKIGGRTGDTLGATVVVSECGFLLGAMATI